MGCTRNTWILCVYVSWNVGAGLQLEVMAYLLKNRCAALNWLTGYLPGYLGCRLQLNVMHYTLTACLLNCSMVVAILLP